MNHQRLMSAVLAAVLLSAGGAHANAGYDRVRARVLSSEPVMQRVNEPRRECWTETEAYDSRRVRDGGNTGGAVIGAIAGGLLGSTVGKGNGKVAAAAVGAATGAVVGNQWNNGDRYYETQPRQVERCQSRDSFRDVVVGYDVRYRFEGRDYTTRLPYQPGRWINLEVNHRVADDQGDTGRWDNNRSAWDD